MLISGFPISPTKAAALIASVAVAYFIAVFSAAYLQIFVMGASQPASPIALLLGGFIGGYIVFYATLQWSCRGITQKAADQEALLGEI